MLTFIFGISPTIVIFLKDIIIDELLMIFNSFTPLFTEVYMGMISIDLKYSSQNEDLAGRLSHHLRRNRIECSSSKSVHFIVYPSEQLDDQVYF